MHAKDDNGVAAPTPTWIDDAAVLTIAPNPEELAQTTAQVVRIAQASLKQVGIDTNFAASFFLTTLHTFFSASILLGRYLCHCSQYCMFRLIHDCLHPCPQAPLLDQCM